MFNPSQVNLAADPEFFNDIHADVEQETPRSVYEHSVMFNFAHRLVKNTKRYFYERMVGHAMQLHPSASSYILILTTILHYQEHQHRVFAHRQECRKYGSVIKVFADQGSSKGDVPLLEMPCCCWRLQSRACGVNPLRICVAQACLRGMGQVRGCHLCGKLPACTRQAGLM